MHYTVGSRNMCHPGTPKTCSHVFWSHPKNSSTLLRNLSSASDWNPLPYSVLAQIFRPFLSISIISVLANRHLSSFNLDHHPSSLHLSSTRRKPLGGSYPQSSWQTWHHTSESGTEEDNYFPGLSREISSVTGRGGEGDDGNTVTAVWSQIKGEVLP